ncbi:hypothetical protein ERJ75_000807500 [Trypanosoma vivax]|nr:hypothetical protein ERJ75_000807500 [Trypanosoma vivax]
MSRFLSSVHSSLLPAFWCLSRASSAFRRAAAARAALRAAAARVPPATMASGGGRDKGRRVHSACAPVSLVAVPGLRVGVPVGRAWPSGACPASPARAAALRPCQFPPMGRGTASSRTRACVTALIAFLYSGRAQPQKPIVASLPCAASLAPRRVCVAATAPRRGNDTGAARLGSEAASSTTLALRRRLGILPVQNAPLEDARRTRSRAPRGAGAPMRDREGGQHGLRERGRSRTSGTITSRRAGRSGWPMAQKRSATGVAPDELSPRAPCLWPVAARRERRGTLTSWRALHRAACARLRTPPRKATPAPLTGKAVGGHRSRRRAPTGAPPERGQRQRVKQAPRIGQAQNGKANRRQAVMRGGKRGVLSAQGASNERLLERGVRGEGNRCSMASRARHAEEAQRQCDAKTKKVQENASRVAFRTGSNDGRNAGVKHGTG